GAGYRDLKKQLPSAFQSRVENRIHSTSSSNVRPLSTSITRRVRQLLPPFWPPSTTCFPAGDGTHSAREDAPSSDQQLGSISTRSTPSTPSRRYNSGWFSRPDLRVWK